ncbi:MAG: phosphatase PAP2 family protein, partial [Verrucomicrobiota bacterium]|nr:phosphatase PAP2 family protein [Verrucomicrobiota bacterium]
MLAFSATLNTQADEQGIASATAGSYALGRRPNELFSFDTLRLFGDDIKYTFTSPARWDDSDWLEAGLLTASVAGTSVFDHGIKTAVQKNRTHGLDTFSKDFQRLGAEGSFVILGGFEAWHLADGNKQAGAVVIDGLSSSLIAAGIITPILKYSIGRARPNETDEAYRFRPFSGKDSFPSGHATQAFAVASVIAADYPEEGW